MGVRFVHTADLHLGSPLQAAGVESSRLQEQLRKATYTAFERVIDLTVEEDVDFLLVAGDLYDQKNRSVKANEFLREQFSRLKTAGIPAFVLYGNHDPTSEGTTYYDLPDNVVEFDSERAEQCFYPDEESSEARIWGQSYRNEAEQRKMHLKYSPPDNSIPNLGMLHTGLDPEASKYVPSSASELTNNSAIHYWALGHIHQPRVYQTDPPIIHPGIPQGRHAGELGPGGCILAEVASDGEHQLEFVPTSPVIWLERDVSIEAEDGEDFDLTTINGLQRYIESEARTLDPGYDTLEERLGINVREPDWTPEGYVCRWVLTGHGETNLLLTSDEPVQNQLAKGLRDSLATDSPFVYTDSIVDRTGPPLPNIGELRGSDRVVDEFFALKNSLDGDQDARTAMRDELDYHLAGNVWQSVEDPEDVDDDKLALTDQKFDELVGRAEELVLNELVRRRAE
jgi:exonuclease SbcD